MAMVFVSDLVSDMALRAVSGDYDYQTLTPCTVPALTWEQFAADAGQALDKSVKVTPIPLPIIKAVAGRDILDIAAFRGRALDPRQAAGVPL